MCLRQTGGDFCIASLIRLLACARRLEYERNISLGNVIASIGSNLKNLSHLSLGNCHLLKPHDFLPLSALEALVSLNLYRLEVHSPAYYKATKPRSLHCMY